MTDFIILARMTAIERFFHCHPALVAGAAFNKASLGERPHTSKGEVRPQTS